MNNFSFSTAITQNFAWRIIFISMKKIFLFLLIFLFTDKIYSQNYRIYYKTEKNRLHLTQINEFTLNVNDSIVQMVEDTPKRTLKDHQYQFYLGKIDLKSNYNFLRNKSSEIFFEKNKFYYSEWENYPMKWQILNETSSLLGFKLIKAKLLEPIYSYKYLDDFEPKEVIAWFCPDIPISGGPKRYYGLPGLILKIEDGSYGTNNRTIATKIEKLTTDPVIEITEEGEYIDKEAIFKVDYWLGKLSYSTK